VFTIGAQYANKGLPRLYVGKTTLGISVGNILREVARLVISIGCALSVIMTIITAHVIYTDYQMTLNQKVVASKHVEPSREELKMAMNHHGTLIAHQRESDRVFVFERDNQEIPLFRGTKLSDKYGK